MQNLKTGLKPLNLQSASSFLPRKALKDLRWFGFFSSKSKGQVPIPVPSSGLVVMV